MTVKIARGVVGRIRDMPSAITIQAGDPSDSRAAAGSLRQAREEISNLDGGPSSAPGLQADDRNNPTWVSDVIELPGGPMLMVDGGLTPFRLLREIPQIVARRLEQSGVSAVVRVPDTSGPLEQLREPSPCVLLRTYATPPHRKRIRVDIPPQWMAAARDWLDALPEAGNPVMCSLQAVEFQAKAEDIGSLLDDWQRHRPGYAVLAVGDLTQSVRAVGVDFSADGNVELVLAAGGPQSDDAALVRAFGDLQAAARDLAPSVAYAFISVEPTFAQLLSRGHSSDWHEAMDGPGPQLAPWVCDEIIVDAFPFQILGPAHIERLGDDRTVKLSESRSEAAIRSVGDWLLAEGFDPRVDPRRSPSGARRDPTVQAHAREVLRPCLVSADAALQLMASRLTTSGQEGAP